MKKVLILVCALLILPIAKAQKISEVMRPLPAAISEEAALPEELAKKYAALEQERQLKFSTSTKAATASVSSELTQMLSTYFVREEEDYQVKYNAADNYRIFYPNYRLLNSSHGRRKYHKDGKSFNAKKDRLSNAIIVNNNEIRILSKKDKTVDMSEFTFETSSEAIQMEGNKIVIKVPVLEIAAGKYPWTHKIICRHNPSGIKYTFDLEMLWRKELDQSGSKNALVLASINNVNGDKMGLLCDLESHNMMVVHLPLVVQGEGRDGADGEKGHYGANGLNQSSYTDKDGVTHTRAGTCAKPGQNGGDGENGGDGGRFLIALDPYLIETYGLDCVIATIDGGKGGKGGKGGEGGIHGSGSGCSGKAPDGKDGKAGQDGKRGDFLYIQADVVSFFSKVLQ